MNLIANPSFDQANEDGPRDWTYRGPAESKAWLPAQGRDGGACLLLRGLVGEMEWESAPVPVAPGGRVALSWWTRIEGREPWHWSYLVDFVGVVVRFTGADGQPAGEHAHHVKCIRTEGWARAWLHLVVPAGASAARVAFVWKAPFETDGAVWVDDVELVDLEQPSEIPVGHGRLRCRVVDAASGRQLAARAYVEDEEGTSYVPRYCLDYPAVGGAFHVPGEAGCELDLPAGEASLRVVRGFEYRPWRGQVAMRTGEVSEVEVRLERLADLPARGWYCGDHHSHLFFHGRTRHPQMTPALAMAVARGEGLNFLPLQAEIGEVLAHLGEHEMERREEFVGELGLEMVSDFWGHVCSLNLRQDAPDGFPMRMVLYPMNADVFASVAKQGSALVYPHPLSNAAEHEWLGVVGDPQRRLLARELAVDLALGYACGYDLLGEDDPEALAAKLAIYYRLLDAGFPVAITAATDYYVDQGYGVPGAVRTYVQAEALDFAAIAAAYRRGATFCTNGPLLELAVEGQGPGGKVRLGPGGAEVEVRLQAQSAWGVSEVELVQGGKVAASFPGQGLEAVEVTTRLEVTTSCWLAARAWGPGAPEVDSRVLPPAWAQTRGQYAHTSPVWVRVKGRPQRPQRATVELLLEWVLAARRAYQGNREALAEAAARTGLAEQEIEARIQAHLDRAEAYYRELMVVTQE